MNPGSNPGEGMEQFIYQASLKTAQSGDPERFARLAERLHVIADAEIGKAQSRAPAPACKAGCAWCCHRLVVALLPEVQAIARAVSAWPEDRRQALVNRLRAHEAAMTPYWRYETDEYARACPFLEEDLCSIFEARPLSCRAMSSYDAEACRARMEKGAGSVPEVPGQSAAVGMVMSATVAGFQAAGQPSGTYDLAFGLLKLLEGSDDLESAKIYIPGQRESKPLGREAASIQASPDFQQYLRFNRSNPQQARELLALPNKQAVGSILSAIVPPIYESSDQLEEWWAQLARDIENIENSSLNPKEAFEALALFDTFFWAYSGKDVKPYLQRFATHAHEQWASKAYPELTNLIESPRKPGKFRLGYASYRLKRFNGSRWALGWLVNHSPDIEKYAFNLNEREDDVSLRWRHNADRYFHLPLPISEAAAIIRAQDLDALILTDVGMDGPTIQLSLLRLARKQMTAWGHPVTSGSPTLDYYLSSELMEPPNGDEHYVERLIRLPGSGLCYPRAELTPSAKSPRELGLPEGPFIFNAQRAAKLLPRFDHLYAEIAERSGKPIVLVNQEEEAGTPVFESRLKRAGVNAVVLKRMERQDFLRVIQLAELVLDSPAWNGGNTTVEALTLGKPVVSLAGEFMRGRHCLAFMAQAGVGGLISADEREYVAFALDEGRQASAMGSLDVAPIYGDLAPARAIESLLLNGA